jgi:fatty-acyl-CoA synthase
VAEVAVIGMPDEKWGERPLALVVPKPEAGLSEKAVVRHITAYADQGHITKQAILVRVRFVDAIDKTSVGKVNKVALREKHL